MKRFLTVIIILSLAACGKKGPKPESTPGPALLTSPLKDQPCTTGTVVSTTESTVKFEWSTPLNADSYNLIIKNLLTQQEINQAVTTNSASATLLRNTPYAWYVTSKSKKTSVTTNSDTWKFYNAGAGIVTYAPFPAEITAPAFGQVLSPSNGKVTLTWKGSSTSNNIIGYDVYFGPSSNPDMFRNHITDMFVNDVTVGKNTTYYWRVVTIDANGNVSDSGLNNFYVK